MEPIYISDEHKEELDSDTYRITQASSDLDRIRQNDLKLYLSALSPADIADFYWGDQAVHEEDHVVATVDDFTDKEGGSGRLYCVVKRSGADGQ
jgi:hypothetical protein